jgi:hypothetical protein
LHLATAGETPEPDASCFSPADDHLFERPLNTDVSEKVTGGIIHRAGASPARRMIRLAVVVRVRGAKLVKLLATSCDICSTRQRRRDAGVDVLAPTDGPRARLGEEERHPAVAGLSTVGAPRFELGISSSPDSSGEAVRVRASVRVGRAAPVPRGELPVLPPHRIGTRVAPTLAATDMTDRSWSEDTARRAPSARLVQAAGLTSTSATTLLVWLLWFERQHRPGDCNDRRRCLPLGIDGLPERPRHRRCGSLLLHDRHDDLRLVPVCSRGNPLSALWRRWLEPLP